MCKAKIYMGILRPTNAYIEFTISAEAIRRYFETKVSNIREQLLLPNDLAGGEERASDFMINWLYQKMEVSRGSATLC